MSPRPRIGLIHQPRESLLLLLAAGLQGLNFVGLLNCAMMREQTGKTPPEFIVQINGGQTANISGLGAANYNYWRQYFFVQTPIFSGRWRCRECSVSIVHCSCDPSAELCRVMFAWKVAVTTGLGPPEPPRPLHWSSVTRPEGLDRDKAGQKKYGIYRLGRGSWLKIWSQSNFDQMFDLRLGVVEPSLG